MPADRDYGPDAPPIRYPDPDVVSLDERFNAYRIGNTTIKRLWTGGLWSEGPAWNGGGRYLVWSDIPNNRQLRYLDENAAVTTFRSPSGNSNGNTFDFQGRQLSCEHGNRRVVRYEHDGSMTVIADRYEGKRLSSPNDIVVHPDGGVWFTDPPYGTQPPGGYEGTPGGEIELPNRVYRADPTTGRVEVVADDLDKPNGICFSHDYARCYVVDTGAPKNINVFDVVDGTRLANGRVFTDMQVNGHKVGPDGIRPDVDGNIWASAGGGEGYDGAICFTPEGEAIGLIRLPERCANIAFGGPKRNRLFMAASQSLYAVYLNTRGAHIA
jgi:gluconolactonase